MEFPYHSDSDSSLGAHTEQESLKEGGYHPVRVGDTFKNGTYRTLCRLGCGHFSTVWLCLDNSRVHQNPRASSATTALSPAPPTRYPQPHQTHQSQSSQPHNQSSAAAQSPSPLPQPKQHSAISKAHHPYRNRVVALKIQKSASDYSEAAKDEIKLLEAVRRSDSNNADDSGTNNAPLICLIDHFEHFGPNGRHVCLVFDLLGGSLLKLIKRFNYKGTPLALVRRISRNMLEGLHFLHSQVGIIHTDLKPENVLFELPPDIMDQIEIQATAFAQRLIERRRQQALNSSGSNAVNSGDPRSAAARLPKSYRRNQKKRMRAKAKRLMADRAAAVGSTPGGGNPQGGLPPTPPPLPSQHPGSEANDNESTGTAATTSGSKADSTSWKQGQQTSSTALLSPETVAAPVQEGDSKGVATSVSEALQPSTAPCENEGSSANPSSVVPPTDPSATPTIGASTNSGEPQPNANANVAVRAPITGGSSDVGGAGVGLNRSREPSANDDMEISFDLSRIVDNVRTFSRGVMKIADLGNACWTHKHFTDDIQTRQYRSPEVIIGLKYGTSVDIWSAACVIFELLTGDYLFDPHTGVGYDRDEDHLALMIELLGPMPRYMTRRGDFSTDLFSRNGELRTIKRLDYFPLHEVLEEKYKMHKEDADLVSSFLLPMLKLDPMKRATARDCLSHPFCSQADMGNAPVRSNSGHSAHVAQKNPGGHGLVAGTGSGAANANVKDARNGISNVDINGTSGSVGVAASAGIPREV